MRIALVVLFAMAVRAASAEPITIDMPEGVAVQRSHLAYECDGTEVDVEYINAGDVSLAVLRFDGEVIVASNVISASGARYAGDRYVWWSKGDEASFFDLMQGGKDAPPTICTTAPRRG